MTPATLRDVDVFEVDHPATQTYKRTFSDHRVPLSRSLRFVPVDFECDRLDQKLVGSGYDPTRRTAWIWEGVTTYLDDEAVRATLDSVAALSAPGSRLIVQYREPAVEDSMQRGMRAAVRRRGEPQIGLRTRTTMRAELERAGIHQISDDGAVDWAVRYGGAAPLAVARPLRLIVGERR
jgi:methyltransferase (TIGR00027 family)